jgi:hypothetical protein
MNGRTMYNGWPMAKFILLSALRRGERPRRCDPRQQDPCRRLDFLRGLHAGAPVHLHEALSLKSFVQGLELGLDVCQ